MRKFLQLTLFIFLISVGKLCAQTASYIYFPFPLNVALCEGVSLVFSDNSTGNPTSWSWDFGVGAIPQTSTQQNPGLVNFPVCGNYHVTLVISGGSVFSQFIDIWCNPTASFITTPTQSCLDVPIAFDATTSTAGSGFLSYLWDFCDGDSSTTGPVVNHDYQNAGCYCATLVVTNNHGCVDFESVQNAVCLTTPPCFTITSGIATSCAFGLQVDFCATNFTGGASPFTYSWNFPGGAPMTSTDSCPQNITYNVVGSWDVSCTVTDANGCTCNVSLNDYVNIGTSWAPIYLSSDTVCVGGTVTVSTTPFASYNWIINPTAGVNPSTPQTTPSVAYNFSAAGTYTITLNAIGNGCAIMNSTTVVVLPNPQASFTVSGNVGACMPPMLITLTNTTPPGNYSYLWNFGDGFTSALQNPQHIYSSCGQFTISLTVTNSFGCSSTHTLSNIININCPEACYTITSLPPPGENCAGATLSFDASCSTGLPTQFLWCVQLQGGPPCVPSNLGPTPTINFPASGCYDITLQTINASGCSATVTNDFTGSEYCVGIHIDTCFSANPLVTCAPVPVVFTNCSSSGPPYPPCTSWCWNFGDGFGCQSTDANPIHQFQDTGCFDITMITSNCGCADTMFKSCLIYVAGPVINLNYTISCDSPNVVIYDGTNSIGADNYQWTFPGGNPSSSTFGIVHVVYPMLISDTSYTAGLIICNDSSLCCDTSLVTVYLNPMNASATIDTMICFGESSSVSTLISGTASVQWKVFDMCNGGVQILTSNLTCFNSLACPGYIQWQHPGFYHVQLRVLYLTGCEDTLDWNVQVNGLEPGFWGGPINGCAPFDVTFHDTTNSNCVSTPNFYQLDFGDGTFVTPPTPIGMPVTHTYTANGNYTITEYVTDQHGCTDTISISNYVNAGLMVSETHISPSCGNANGIIDLTISSGTSPYTYAWSNGATTQDIFSIAAGIYSVTINDVSGCITTFSVTLVVTNGITLSQTHQNASCGNSNGSINLSVSGGTFPFTYQWSSGATSQDLSTLSAGTFTVTVTDAVACTAVLSVTISNSNGTSLSQTHINAACGNANGSINLSVTNGTAPFIYSWSNGATTQDIYNLSVGNYLVTVTDVNNCTAALSVTITNSNAPVITSTFSNELCGGTNGSITTITTGGTPTYTYAWSNGATTSSINNLSSGNYSVTVTDANGCTDSVSVVLINFPAPTITLTHIDASCLTCHDGSATVFISGGAPPYTILWNTGSNSNPIINIDPGVYVVCVTDANGCSVCDSVEVFNATGIFSLTENNSIKIIPNPNSGIFTLSISKISATENIEIINLLGEKIFELKNIPARNIQIDLTQIPDGIYFIKVNNERLKWFKEN